MRRDNGNAGSIPAESTTTRDRLVGRLWSSLIAAIQEAREGGLAEAEVVSTLQALAMPTLGSVPVSIAHACLMLLVLSDVRGSKPTVSEVLPFVRAYYEKPGNGAGGKLHVVLDDGNVEDEFVDSCIREANLTGDSDGEWLGRALRRMSKTQRRRLADGKRKEAAR